MIKLGTSDLSKAYVGSTEVSKVYLGSDLVYSKGPEVLPYDAEIEYLGFTGSQYIELPIIPNEVTDCIEIEFRRTDNTNQQRFFIACPDGNSSSNAFQSYINNYGRIAYNNGSWTALSNSDDTVVGLVHHVLKFDYHNKVVTYDGGSFTISNVSRASSFPLVLFGAYGTNVRFKGIIYKVRYWRNNVMIHSFQPVRKNDIGYLYDEISRGMYGNSGTGSITIGYDKLRNLSDYTQLDYISNTSFTPTSPYIDTMIASNAGRIEMGMVVKWNTIDSTKRQLFGSVYSPFFGCDKGEYKYQSNSMSLPTPSTSFYDTVSTPIYGGKPQYPQNLSLFRSMTAVKRQQQETTYICSCKLKNYWINVGGVLVRDFVPVLHPSGVYGMFDRIENKFYASATSVGFSGGYDN